MVELQVESHGKRRAFVDTRNMCKSFPEEEFHVALWRLGEEKLGLKLAVADNTLRIFAITGGRVEEMNQRCRNCHVKQILNQQLLREDQVVSVNGKTELLDMLEELSNVKVECCHMRVRGLPRARVIKNYDPRSEPENGYLDVIEGILVTVQPGSLSASENGNLFQCEYVFAKKTDLTESWGWLPVDILENVSV